MDRLRIEDWDHRDRGIMINGDKWIKRKLKGMDFDEIYEAYNIAKNTRWTTVRQYGHYTLGAGRIMFELNDDAERFTWEVDAYCLEHFFDENAMGLEE